MVKFNQNEKSQDFAAEFTNDVYSTEGIIDLLRKHLTDYLSLNAYMEAVKGTDEMLSIAPDWQKVNEYAYLMEVLIRSFKARI